MTTVFGVATLGFAASLAVALWRLVVEVRVNSKLRLELRGVIDRARAAESKHKREADRNLGYQAVVRRLKENLDEKNTLLEKHGVGPSVVLDGLLSKGDET